MCLNMNSVQPYVKHAYMILDDVQSMYPKVVLTNFENSGTC